LFDPDALALALCDGRIDACLLDGANPQFAATGSPLHGIPNLHLTPRLGSHTREAKLRSSWYVAHRIHECLTPAEVQREVANSDFSAFELAFGDSIPMDARSITPSRWGGLSGLRP